MKINDILEYSLSPAQKQNAVNSKATIIIKMPPKEFLKLTINATEMKYLRDRLKSKEQYQQYIDSGETIVHPFLKIDEDSGKVMSHEGRARAVAAWLSGAKLFEIAVVLYPGGRHQNIEDVPGRWMAQYNKNHIYDFETAKNNGSVIIIDDNVQWQYNNKNSTKK